MLHNSYMTDESEKINTSSLEERIDLLNEHLRKQTSFRYIFTFSVVRGIGYGLGATIIAGAVLAIVLQLVSSIDYVPLINQFLTSEEVREMLRSFKEI